MLKKLSPKASRGKLSSSTMFNMECSKTKNTVTFLHLSDHKSELENIILKRPDSHSTSLFHRERNSASEKVSDLPRSCSCWGDTKSRASTFHPRVLVKVIDYQHIYKIITTIIKPHFCWALSMFQHIACVSSFNLPNMPQVGCPHWPHFTWGAWVRGLVAPQRSPATTNERLSQDRWLWQ